MKYMKEKEGQKMNYMVCIPSPDMVSRENCEKVHNILARMSDAYKLNIVPEPVKVKQAPCPEYYRKYRIYKEIRERDGNGEAYLLQEEEDMILSVCRTPEEEALMKGCTYAYRYPSSLVLKSFREDKKEKKVIKNMVDYEVYRPVYVRVRDAADGCGVQPRSKSDVVCERRFF